MHRLFGFSFAAVKGILLPMLGTFLMLLINIMTATVFVVKQRTKEIQIESRANQNQNQSLNNRKQLTMLQV
jgi:hypothetical protein